MRKDEDKSEDKVVPSLSHSLAQLLRTAKQTIVSFKTSIMVKVCQAFALLKEIDEITMVKMHPGFCPSSTFLKIFFSLLSLCNPSSPQFLNDLFCSKFEFFAKFS